MLSTKNIIHILFKIIFVYIYFLYTDYHLFIVENSIWVYGVKVPNIYTIFDKDRRL